MADTLMSGFVMRFFQHRSLLNFQRAQEKAHPRCNLQTIFKVRAVPSDTQMRMMATHCAGPGYTTVTSAVGMTLGVIRLPQILVVFGPGI